MKTISFSPYIATMYHGDKVCHNKGTVNINLDNVEYLNNDYYCELAGIYQMYKEVEAPYYGCLHYRRYLELYNKYKELADTDDKVIFGGRIGEYKYYDMDDTIKSALKLVKDIL